MTSISEIFSDNLNRSILEESCKDGVDKLFGKDVERNTFKQFIKFVCTLNDKTIILFLIRFDAIISDEA